MNELLKCQEAFNKERLAHLETVIKLEKAKVLINGIEEERANCTFALSRLFNIKSLIDTYRSENET